jgi:hypothetical protein
VKKIWIIEHQLKKNEGVVLIFLRRKVSYSPLLYIKATSLGTWFFGASPGKFYVIGLAGKTSKSNIFMGKNLIQHPRKIHACVSLKHLAVLLNGMGKDCRLQGVEKLHVTLDVLVLWVPDDVQSSEEAVDACKEMDWGVFEYKLHWLIKCLQPVIILSFYTCGGVSSMGGGGTGSVPSNWSFDDFYHVFFDHFSLVHMSDHFALMKLVCLNLTQLM